MMFPQQIPVRIALPNLIGYYLARSYQGGMLTVSRLFHTQILWEVEAHQGQEITSLAWSYDGEMLASSGQDDTIRIWLAATGMCLYSFSLQEEVDRLQWSSSGKLAATSGNLVWLLPLPFYVSVRAA